MICCMLILLYIWNYMDSHFFHQNNQGKESKFRWFKTENFKINNMSKVFNKEAIVKEKKP